MLPLIIAPLVEKGLSLIANAAMAKGKEWVQEKTGIDLSKPELSEEEFVKLRQYEMDHEEELIRLRQDDDKLQAAIEEMYLKDTQDARDMQKEALKSGDRFAAHFIYWYTIVMTILSVVYIGAVTFLEIPKANMRFADTILGFLMGTMLAQMINFFYGSSRSSQRKDELIAQAKQEVLK